MSEILGLDQFCILVFPAYFECKIGSKNEMKNEGARVEQNRVFLTKFEGMRLVCFRNQVVILSSFRDEVHRNLVRLISEDRLTAIIDSLQSFFSPNHFRFKVLANLFQNET